MKNYNHKLNKFPHNHKLIKKTILNKKIGTDVEVIGISENGLDKCLRFNAKKEKNNGNKELMSRLQSKLIQEFKYYFRWLSKKLNNL